MKSRIERRRREVIMVGRLPTCEFDGLDDYESCPALGF